MIEDTEYPDGATPLDPNERGGLKHKHITTRGELDELEQVNIESGLRWLTRQRGDVLTEKAWVVNGELVEADVDKFIHDRLAANAVITPCKQ